MSKVSPQGPSKGGLVIVPAGAGLPEAASWLGVSSTTDFDS